MRRITETKPDGSTLEREAQTGGLPPLPGPALNGDDHSSKATSDGAVKAVRSLLDKYADALASFLGQDVIDTLTAFADGTDNPEVRESCRAKIFGESAPISRKQSQKDLAQFAKNLR